MTTIGKTLMMLSFIIMCSLLLQGESVSIDSFQNNRQGRYSYYRGDDSEFLGAEMVIGEGRTWAWFWKMHTRGIQPAPPLPKVDFSKTMVLVVMLGYQTSGGGPSIEISSVEGIFNVYVLPIKSIRVLVRENRTPGPLDVITNPYHIVSAPKSISVVFEHKPSKKHALIIHNVLQINSVKRRLEIAMGKVFVRISLASVQRFMALFVVVMGRRMGMNVKLQQQGFPYSIRESVKLYQSVWEIGSVV